MRSLCLFAAKGGSHNEVCGPAAGLNGGLSPTIAPDFCPYAGRHSVDTEVAAAVGEAAVAAATTGQQQSVAGNAEISQRPRRAASARVAAAVYAAQDGDAPTGAVHKRNGTRNKVDTLPEGYTVAGLTIREKRLWDAKQVRWL